MYGITGATGALGGQAVRRLLDHDVAADQIVALVRDTDRAAPLADAGVTVRRGDFDDPSTLTSAFEGIDRLLVVSVRQVGQRERQHGAAIRAAQQAGVQRLVYTSFLGAQTHPENPLTPEHKATEAILADAGIPEVVVLRNGFYHENILDRLDQILASGELVGAAGAGVINAAARDELAEAAVIALMGDVAPGAYDLVGAPTTQAQIAEQIAEASGRPVAYREVTLPQYQQGLEAAGVPAEVAAFFTEVEKATGAGAMASDATALREILGREPRSIGETARLLLEAQRA